MGDAGKASSADAGTLVVPKTIHRQGATAGASSAQFDIYRRHRREENFRLESLKEEKEAREKNAAHQRKIEANLKEAEERTARKAEKRRRRKANEKEARRKKKSKKVSKAEPAKSSSSSNDADRAEMKKLVEQLESEKSEAGAANKFANDGSFMDGFLALQEYMKAKQRA